VKHMDDERAEAARVAEANRTASALAGKRSAEADTADANRARRNAEGMTRDAQDSARTAVAGQAQAERDNADAQQQKLAAQADSERNRAAAANANQANVDALQHQRDAESESARSRLAASDANSATADAQQRQKDAENESERNRLAAANSDKQLQQAVRDREELRARLLVQFNTILETRDTARGLVVNMSDVLFDSAKFTLRPAAREKLAKISGIVLAYPSLALSIEGNTDSVGTDAYNQTLSENRAGSVRDYLGQQGIPAASMTAHGFGKTQPVASNDTAGGRQQNRRVELVVSGEVIGTTVAIGPTAMEILPLNSRR
jgi:outer membrane protein OmpA-like peptidoglycan-associated protein